MGNCLCNKYVLDESTWSNFKEVILTMFSSNKLCISNKQGFFFFFFFFGLKSTDMLVVQ
jgi:hypothetical protein